MPFPDRPREPKPADARNFTLNVVVPLFALIALYLGVRSFLL